MTETPAAPAQPAPAPVTPASSEGGSSRLALVAAIVLGVAAVLTAWGAYREGLTSDGVLKNYSEQAVLVAQANDTFSLADAQEALEQQFFLSYAINAAEGNEGATAYLEATMSEELVAVVNWWADQPESSQPSTPFVEENPAYAQLPSQLLTADGAAMMDEAETKRIAAEEADAVSDRFGLANVFFAVVLFVAGIAALLQRKSLQLGILVLSILMLGAGVAILVTTPGWSSIA